MQNKKLLLVPFVLLFISFSVFSQVSPFVIGIESGIGLSSTRPSLNDNSVRVGFTEALTSQYIFSDLLSVKTGLAYELKGSKGVLPLESNPVGEGIFYQNFHFLTIPILAKATFSKKVSFFRNEIKYFANAGPYFGFLLKQNSKLVATEYSAEEKINNTENYKRVEFGLSIGGGLAYSVYKNMDITLELRDNLGLNNLNKGTQNNGSSIKTNSAYIIVGLGFRL